MALSLKITGHASDTEDILLDIAPPWWKIHGLKKDSRFIRSSKPGHPLDYDAYLTLEEMQKLHERYRSAATTGVYASEHWQELIQPMIAELDEALYAAVDNYGYFHLRIFEWESGLND